MIIVSGVVISHGGVILQPRGVLQPRVRLGYSYSLPLSYIAAAPVLNSYKFIKQVPEKSVSYSLAYKDYLYLQKHKDDGGSPFDPDPIHEGPDYLHVENYHHSQHKNKHVETVPIHTDAQVAASETLKSNVGHSIILDHSFPAAALPEPKVSKHIYFHVPPPDFEEQPRVPIALTPQKKRYNIIFIKAPSQEPNSAQLQQISPDEQKTLIYVLSKQQEQSVPVVLPPKAVSAPEVYFIKYKVNPRDGEKINSEFGETSFLQSVSPLLEPRLGQDKP